MTLGVSRDTRCHVFTIEQMFYLISDLLQSTRILKQTTYCTLFVMTHVMFDSLPLEHVLISGKHPVRRPFNRTIYGKQAPRPDDLRLADIVSH